MTRKEDQEQIALFNWAKSKTPQIPELDLLYHIPNGGKRSKVEASIFKAMGVKAGMPDVHLPVARGKYHSLYIEMKSAKGRLSKLQKAKIKELMRAGNQCAVCYSMEEARDDILRYLEIEKEPS